MTSFNVLVSPSAQFRGRLRVTLVGAVVAAATLPAAVIGAPSSTKFKQPAAGGPAAACEPVTAASLRRYAIAVRATTTAVRGGVVTLRVVDRFRGRVADRITVPQGRESVVDGAPIRFRNNTTYLIVARGGRIVTCGFSGPETRPLAKLYRDAFAPMP